MKYNLWFKILFYSLIFGGALLFGYVSNTKAEEILYSKIKPIKNDSGQYCYVKIEIKQEGDNIVKREILECADGKRGIETPGYWELFAQFYYRDVSAPEYCRYYNRPNHVFKSFGKTCLKQNGEWEVK